jgi:hypothetical protein
MMSLRDCLRLAFGFAAVTLVLAVSAGAAVSGPLVLAGGEGGGGPALGGMGPSGVTVRFIDRGRFFVGVLVRNGSSHTLTVVNAHVPEPPHSLVRQVGTRLGLVPPCNAHGLCDFGPTGADAARLRPVALTPGAEAAVQISYKLGSCAEVPHSSLATARVIEVSYKDSHGVLQQQTLPIGGGLLHLQKPAGVECVPRPFSHIGLVGSFTTSPGHKPVPGSDGDTCTKSATGRLVFRSRLFTERSGVEFRVEIAFPHFVGKGLYETSTGHASLGPADVIVSGGFGDRGWTTFHGHPEMVTVTQAAAPLYGGRFQAVLSGHRRFFRAYGAWRCTTKLR